MIGNLPDEVVELNRTMDRSYRILCGLFTETPIVLDGEPPILPGDPRRDDMFVDISAYLVDYTRIQNDHDIPEWIVQKHMFLLTMIRWMLNPDDDLFIDIIEYDPDEFGDDVAKTGYTPAEIRKYTRKRPLNKLRLGSIEQSSCTICLEEFDPTEVVSRLNCYHVFHDGCLQGWLNHNKTCPLCVTDISVKPLSKRKEASKTALSAAPSEVDGVTRRSKRLRGLPPSPVK